MRRLAELAIAMEHLLHVLTGVEAENRRLVIRRLAEASPTPASKWVFDDGVAISVEVSK